MSRKKPFTPSWSEKAPVPGTIRSVIKYGSPTAFKHPSPGWVRMMMDEFHMSEDDFSARREEGNAPVALDRPVAMEERHIERFKAISGAANVVTDAYSRVRYACGKTTEELMELRKV